MTKRAVFFLLMFFFCLFRAGTGFAQEEDAGKQEPPKQIEKQDADAEKQELLKRIEEMEKRINEITEEERARRKLEVTEQEKQEKEKEVLEAVSRDYTLEAKRTLGLDYTMNYTYTPSQRITNQLIVDNETDHTLRHTLSASYALLDNLSVSTSLPFVYRYNQMGTDTELDTADIGDISFGVSVQPVKSKTGEVRTTLSFSFSLPTGRSPYEIVPDSELSTGNGTYCFSVGANFSKQIDPVVAFWNVGYSHALTADGLDYRVADVYVLEKVEPGDTISVGAGLAYALSYKVSVNASFSYSYQRTSKYYYEGASKAVKSGDTTGAGMGFGVGWRASSKTTMSIGVSYGLTGSGFSLTFRVPFTFVI